MGAKKSWSSSFFGGRKRNINLEIFICLILFAFFLGIEKNKILNRKHCRGFSGSHSALSLSASTSLFLNPLAHGPFAH